MRNLPLTALILLVSEKGCLYYCGFVKFIISLILRPVVIPIKVKFRPFCLSLRSNNMPLPSQVNPDIPYVIQILQNVWGCGSLGSRLDPGIGMTPNLIFRYFTLGRRPPFLKYVLSLDFLRPLAASNKVCM